MAKFSQNTLNQVAGFDGQILAEELVWNQKDFWNMEWGSTTTSSGWVTNTSPIDLSGATIDAQIVRRDISNFHNSRTGLDFTIQDYPAIPLIQTITATEITSDLMTCSSTAEMYIGQPVNFTGTVFGGVAINTTYYVLTIPTATTFTISATSGGAVFALATATGSMAMNKIDPTPVSLPITNRVDAQIVRRDISNFHNSRTGLDFIVQDYPAIPLIQTITATEITSDLMTCSSTAEMYIGQPVNFTGTVFGNVLINTTYYVLTIPTATTFTISATSGGAVFALATATGSMAMNKIDPTPVVLPITNRVDASGTFTITIDDDTWGVITGDPDLDINAIEPACFSGRLKISFPALVIGATTQPAYDQVVFLLFLINSDGVINY